MSVKALIATIILGTSTLASAGTLHVRGQASFRASVSAPVYTAPTYAAPVVRDHRWNDSRYETPTVSQTNYSSDDSWIYERAPQPAHRTSSWMSLGQIATPLYNESYHIAVNPRMGDISRIMFQGDYGKNAIFDVTVRFADGRSQVYQVNQYIGEKGTGNLPVSPSFVLDLKGSQCVVGLDVHASKPVGTAFSILAI